jgi:hypothetical protein
MRFRLLDAPGGEFMRTQDFYDTLTLGIGVQETALRVTTGAGVMPSHGIDGSLVRLLGILVGRALLDGATLGFRLCRQFYDLMSDELKPDIWPEMRLRSLTPELCHCIDNSSDATEWLGIVRQEWEDAGDFKARVYSTLCGPIFRKTHRREFVRSFNSVFIPQMPPSDAWTVATSLFNVDELADIVGGNTDADYLAYFNTAVAGDGFNPTSPHMGWYRVYVGRSSRLARLLLCRLLTGTAVLDRPLAANRPLTIVAVHDALMADTLLPMCNKSSRTLIIPEYTRREVFESMMDRLLTTAPDSGERRDSA